MDVSGRVMDENGVALPGVSVLEKGTSSGAVTDADGKFALTFQAKPFRRARRQTSLIRYKADFQVWLPPTQPASLVATTLKF